MGLINNTLNLVLPAPSKAQKPTGTLFTLAVGPEDENWERTYEYFCSRSCGESRREELETSEQVGCVVEAPLDEAPGGTCRCGRDFS